MRRGDYTPCLIEQSDSWTNYLYISAKECLYLNVTKGIPSALLHTIVTHYQYSSTIHRPMLQGLLLDAVFCQRNIHTKPWS